MKESVLENESKILVNVSEEIATKLLAKHSCVSWVHFRDQNAMQSIRPAQFLLILHIFTDN